MENVETGHCQIVTEQEQVKEQVKEQEQVRFIFFIVYWIAYLPRISSSM